MLEDRLPIFATRSDKKLILDSNFGNYSENSWKYFTSFHYDCVRISVSPSSCMERSGGRSPLRNTTLRTASRSVNPP